MANERKSVVINFANPIAAKHFLSWLCESGKQQYWNWMEGREREEKGDITAISFDYHGGVDDGSKGFGECDIETECGRLNAEDDEVDEEAISEQDPLYECPMCGIVDESNKIGQAGNEYCYDCGSVLTPISINDAFDKSAQEVKDMVGLTKSLRGTAGRVNKYSSEEDAELLIEEWHKIFTGMNTNDMAYEPLHEYLGLTKQEYGSWVERQKTVAEIFADRDIKS